MKTTKAILLTAILFTLPAVTGCTQPDGYIGDWFGTWYLEEMLLDGEPDQVYADFKAKDEHQVVVSFQANVVNFSYLNGSEIYGTWSYAGDTLTLISSYSSGAGHTSYWFDPYPIVMHFPSGQDQLEVTVTRLGSRAMQWQYVIPSGQLVTYNFRKYP